MHHYDVSDHASSRKQIAQLIADCRKEIDLTKGLKVQLATRSLDEGCLFVMTEFASTTFFARPSKQDIEAQLQANPGITPTQLKLSAYLYYDSENKFFDSVTTSLMRLLDLEVLRCDVGAGGAKYAYHWTPFGDAVLKALGYRK